MDDEQSRGVPAVLPRRDDGGPGPLPDRRARRIADETLPLVFRFLLSLVLLVGGFVYLYLAKPEALVASAVIGFAGAVVGFWFVRSSDKERADAAADAERRRAE